MQTKPQYEVLDEFNTMAAQLVEKYPEEFGEIDVDQIVAYSIVNKERPERQASKPYHIKGAVPPESFTNSKTYFVTIFHDVWDRTRSQKLALVFAALERIDTTNPGKVKPLDYADQEAMVSTFGASWHERGDLPDLLSDNVDFR